MASGYPGGRNPYWDRTRFWDRNGKPLHLLQWGWLSEQRSYRQVAHGFVASASDLRRAYCVCTIWYGMHEYLVWMPGDNIPPLFRTAVLRLKAFDPERNTINDSVLVEESLAMREADARALHDATMARVTAWVDEPLVSHQPVVPARPRDGWAVERAAMERASHG